MQKTENLENKILNTHTEIKSKDNFEFDIIGMSCNGCANSINTYLTNLDGINNVNINFTSENGKVNYDSKKISKEFITTQIKSLGFDVLPEDNEDESDKLKLMQLRNQKIKLISAAFLSLLIMAVSMREHIHILNLNFLSENFSLILLIIMSSIVIFWCGSKFLKGSITSLKNKTSDMNTLITIGSMSSYLYSLAISINLMFGLNLKSFAVTKDVYFETAAMIITFILLGNYLEAVLKSRTQSSIKKLKELQTKVVTIIRNGIELTVPFKKVKINDIVVIKIGDKIPVDGIIMEGFCVVDESAMTGESLPIEKNAGDSLISGTLMKNGFVKMKAVKVGMDTMLSKIIELVKDASNTKPKIQKIADKISSVFVPIVILISIATFLTWHFIFSAEFGKSLLFAVSVLIIACPCALGLASPIAIVIGVGRAAENGILFNNADAIENLAKINTICFDKTGTLTTGEMQVKNIQVLNDLSEKELMKIVYSIEKLSNHPIAKSIINYGKDNNLIPETNVTEFTNESGFGVSAKVNEKFILIGNDNLMNSRGIVISDIINHNQKNKLYVSVNSEIAGVIEIEDKIKEEAFGVIKKLEENNLKIFMISGDNESAAKKVAAELSIKDFSFKTLPDEKEKIISKLQSESKNVAMIGDGINDAPALAKANVGIAIGAGQEIAIDSADVILVKDDLNNILKSIMISRNTVRIIKQNFFWAFFYNVVAIPIAAGVFAPFGIVISPVMAAMLMAASDIVTVFGNSIRLKYMNIN